MFTKILIANRGEIACRIIRTARRMGISTVAVYSEADASARHVALADEAVLVGPPAAAESYLRTENLVQAALRTAAQAIHPGYGFLSENADFAEACQAAGLVFIGPPASSIRAMGSKSEAKRIMGEAGVPLVPGYHGEEQDPAVLASQADKIGYPVLIKASAGGGGKGMRVVTEAKAFKTALATAMRESKAAFGDDRMLIEKYLLQPRHVEIQVFADSHGHCVHLFERDCSLQRRHQKVVEEAPGPGLSTARRQAMGEAAVAAARAIGYTGAGTVEFILDQGGEFYFMEMNTRLQVEHPVTECITGQDLVEWQLRVAAGETLPLDQESLSVNGHAVEARIYAEDPDRDFLPATGTLRHLRFARESDHVRIDSGVREGDVISMHYDPMIAKLVVWDRDRAGALRRMLQALAETEIVGVTTNIDFLASVIAHPDFQAGAVDTGFIDRHRAELVSSGEAVQDRVLALASLFLLTQRKMLASQAAARSADPWSPWQNGDGWRMNDDSYSVLWFKVAGEPVSVKAHYRGQAYQLDLPGGSYSCAAQLDADGMVVANLDGLRVRARVVGDGHDLVVMLGSERRRLSVQDPLSAGMEVEAAAGSLQSPMPGRVLDVFVQAGARVCAGAPLLVLEAMKMEHTILAPRDGVVAAVHYKAGDLIDEGVDLVDFQDQES
jgi:3-methylcrotonyl-CoA carboxylase alpha subunit